MCGLAGFWTPAGFSPRVGVDIVTAMTDRIVSRGPDACGSWWDAELGIALGHRRLSVIELSDAGAQPMISRSGRYVLVFNGEIYNHLALRERLVGAGHAGFRGHSDTETLLAAIDAWGVEETLHRCAGMFAFACWDRRDRVLILGRDRMGEKPLYYGWQGSGSGRTLLFGSELKALTVHPTFNGIIDRKAIDGYLARLCVPGTECIWQGIAKVPPGAIVRIASADTHPIISRYWSVEDAIHEAKDAVIDDPEEGQQLVHDRLSDAVRGQLLSDVPLGALLSGGIDSSLVVALMQEVGNGRAKTFSIGFEEDDFNEADHARAVASHLETDHHELVVSPEHARSVIPKLPLIYDEPFADSSQIPTFLVCELAREHVTVALSGDGADELFGGYTRYTKALQAWDRAAAVPAVVRGLSSGIAAAIGSILPQRVARAGRIAGAKDLSAFYGAFTDHSLGTVPRATKPLELAGLSPAEQLMANDQVGYLPDDILVKIDRASMAVSLEVRAPFLDHRVVCASWRLSSAIKRREENGKIVGKWPLRRLLDRYVPRELIERPKQGFGIPLAAWLRGPLRDWADDLLARDHLARMSLVPPDRAAALWSAHRSGRADYGEQVWALAMLSAWHAEHFAPARAAAAAKPFVQAA